MKTLLALAILAASASCTAHRPGVLATYTDTALHSVLEGTRAQVVKNLHDSGLLTDPEGNRPTLAQCEKLIPTITSFRASTDNESLLVLYRYEPEQDDSISFEAVYRHDGFHRLIRHSTTAPKQPIIFHPDRFILKQLGN